MGAILETMLLPIKPRCKGRKQPVLLLWQQIPGLQLFHMKHRRLGIYRYPMAQMLKRFPWLWYQLRPSLLIKQPFKTDWYRAIYFHKKKYINLLTRQANTDQPLLQRPFMSSTLSPISLARSETMKGRLLQRVSQS